MNTIALRKSRMLKILLCIGLALTIIFASLNPAQAATQKNLKAGTYVTYKNASKMSDVFYKISVPSDGLITINKNSDSSVYVYAKANTSSKQYGGVWYGQKSGTIALAKGTYYIKANDDYTNINGKYQYYHKLKWSFKKISPQANYTLSKAVNLAAGKGVHVVQTKALNYARWYKITLKKNQKITYFTTDGTSISLFDKNFNSINTKFISSGTQTNKYQSALKLVKGTYYVRIEPKYMSYFQNYTAHWGYFKWN